LGASAGIGMACGCSFTGAPTVWAGSRPISITNSFGGWSSCTGEGVVSG
jgi:hypothetical protein